MSKRIHGTASNPWSGTLAVLLTAAAAGTWPACAVTFLSTDDPTYNAPALGGDLPPEVASFWIYEGLWGNFLGTAISPYHFITASHVGAGASGNTTFTYQGKDYQATLVANHSNADLSIWEVAERMPSWAPLWTSTGAEAGKELVVIGRGTLRGAEVMGPSSSGGEELKGWRQGGAGGTQRWGMNEVAAIGVDGSGNSYLVAEFDDLHGTDPLYPYEAHLTAGDSGGAVFIQDPVDSLWKLAGINAGVDGLYSLTGGADTGFRAVLFDKGGLYVGTQNQWTPVAEGPNDVPSRFYATQVSAYQDWVQALIPEPRAYALVTGGLLIAEAIRRRARR